MTQSGLPRRLRLSVLISGRGRTLENLLTRSADGRLLADVVQVISSTPRAEGLRFASEFSVAAETISPKKFSQLRDFSQAIFARCAEVQADYVVMGGWLKLLWIPPEFALRVLNIHPSLLPAFGGQGYYGMRVHQAVIDYGVKISGCTVHFVDNQFDHGPIIAQKAIAVDEDETPETLALRVFGEECELYPEVLNRLALGQFSLAGRRVRLSQRSDRPLDEVP